MSACVSEAEVISHAVKTENLNKGPKEHKV